MHDAFLHLARRVGEARDALLRVMNEVEQQSGREVKVLEQAAYGDDFDEELAPIQEEVVAAMTRALEHLEAADERLGLARQTLEEIPDL